MPERSPDLSEEARAEAEVVADKLCRRWFRLCEHYLPVQFEDSIWRFNRDSKPQEPVQGWKLHISATILEACDLFERVAAFLISEDVQFKAPNSLEGLFQMNSGLQYGYHQVGKFITIYPASEKQALEIARQVHELTKEFFPISIPFDEQYLPESSVFYRYGAFSDIKATDENGETFSAIENETGKLVLDDRKRAVPDWVSDPFPMSGKPTEQLFADTPLGTTYRVFRAVTQRGKGGTYEAIDLSRNNPRPCIVKEGRKNGELSWDGQDGYCLVKNEFEVLGILKEKYDAVPQVFSSFEIHGNFYFAMEYVHGQSLSDIMKIRRRRFSFRKITHLSIKIAKVIEKIHSVDWIWNDCKPANLILTKNGSLRPIDFENAHPITRTEPFDWKSKGFSKPSANGGKSADIYALGAVTYFLLTGRLYDAENPIKIEKLRRSVPEKLAKNTEKLLSDSVSDISEARREFEKILDSH